MRGRDEMTGRRLLMLMLVTSLATPTAHAESIVLTFAGDTGLNEDRAAPLAAGGLKHGDVLDWASIAASALLLEGDLTFVNLETAVTDDRDLTAADKRFVFAMHPRGIAALIAAGADGFSLSNNHALDYGYAGAGETIRHLRAAGAAAYPGLGRTRAEAAAPHLLQAGRARVAFASLGIGGAGFPSAEGGAGKLNWNVLEDRADTFAALAAVPAQIRVLAVHQGREYDVQADAGLQQEFAEALSAGADVVAGHHQHVASAVAQDQHGRIALFGLGNFMHFGTADLAGNGPCRDFGLIVRVRMTNLWGRWRASELEAIPISHTHRIPRRLDPAAARVRLAALNALSAAVSDAGLQPVIFGADPDGTGRACLSHARASCVAPPLALADDTLRAVARSCGPASARVAGPD